MDKIKIGKFLKQLRYEKGLSVEGFCDEMIKRDRYYENPSMINKWERGETFPSIDKLEDLSDFYKVSIDEIFNGKRKIDIDYTKKYFIYDINWASSYDYKTNNLWQMRNEQEMLIEKTFNELLLKLVNNTISTQEECEFDFICTYFYKFKDDDEYLKTKFEVRKQCALMHKSNSNEKLWEANKLFHFKYNLDYFRDMWSIFEGGKDMIVKRLQNTSMVQKDILLAFAQNNDLHNFYTNSNVFEKVYGRKYDAEYYTKEVIKVLIENGACINKCLINYYEINKTKRKVIDMLEVEYKKYYKPIRIAVYENQKYSYYTIENTEKNRKILGLTNYEYDESPEFGRKFDKNLLKKLESKLYNGEEYYIDETKDFVGIEDIYNENYNNLSNQFLEDSLECINYAIEEESYISYLEKRDVKRTQQLLQEIDKLSLKELRKKYFPMETRINEQIY